MATLPTKVQPGDLISSDLMNAMLDELAQLRAGLGAGGTEVVPNVFGAFLANARSIIAQPTRQLTLGFVYDVSGASVDPLASVNQNLIVLNQNPSADTRVAPNTPVNLVVSRAAAGTTPTGSPPTITRTETATGTAATSFPVGSTMVIVGTNFSANAAQNIVRFDGTPADVSSDPADPTRRLSVVVPVGIPGAPQNAGDSARSGVVVTVQTPAGAPATTTITVTAPVAGQPTIISVDPMTQFEGGNITIVGTNFAPSAQVLIRSVGAAIVSRTLTQIVATVPNFADITSGLVPASLTVSVPDVGSATFTGTFRVRGSA